MVKFFEIIVFILFLGIVATGILMISGGLGGHLQNNPLSIVIGIVMALLSGFVIAVILYSWFGKN